tara:strand:+ start:3101 stop:3280 length:180 start_codon:yes stop_codon:yes gene_type:complete
MQLLELMERIKKKQPYNTQPGTVYRIFEIHERAGKNIDGQPYVFLKPEKDEKKIKKSIN